MLKDNPYDIKHFNEIFANSNRKEWTVYQFGVASGNTMVALMQAIKNNNGKLLKAYGFDSFLGLCKEKEGVEISPDWEEGAFNVVDELNQHHNVEATTDEAVQIVTDRLNSHGDISIVKGWYSDLTEQTIVDYNLKPADFLDIDCDLYISTIQALDFMFGNNLIAKDCIIRYDDWTSNNNVGENKAHNEIEKKYNVVFDDISTSKKVFVVRKYDE